MNKNKIKTYTVNCFFIIVFIILILIFRMGIAFSVEKITIFVQNLGPTRSAIISLFIGVPFMVFILIIYLKMTKKASKRNKEE